MDLYEVVCPSCFETFEVAAPVIGEAVFPVEYDYDCAICCRPMMIVFEQIADDGELCAQARGLGE